MSRETYKYVYCLSIIYILLPFFFSTIIIYLNGFDKYYQQNHWATLIRIAYVLVYV